MNYGCFIPVSRTAGLLVGTGLFLAGVGGAAQDSGNELHLQERSGEPFRELSPQQLQAFTNGQISYSTPITIDGGLGPIFNKTNCTSCHGTGLIIGGPGTIGVTFFGGDDKGSFVDLGHLGGPSGARSCWSPHCSHWLLPSSWRTCCSRACIETIAVLRCCEM